MDRWTWLKRAISAGLLPAECAACDMTIGSDRVFCTTCAAALPTAPLVGSLRDGTQWWATAPHCGPAAIAIHRLKYGGRADLAARLARWAVEHHAVPPRADRLVPVPLHAKRLAERGFNQAGLIASALSRWWGIPSRPLTLRRSTYTINQARLGRTARARNVCGSYAARGKLTGERVILVDDVLTTGATALSCIEALHEAGARTRLVVAITLGGRDASTLSRSDVA